MSGRHDCGGDAAAYVLGALSAAEADAFETHMAECVVCRDEVAALQQVTDALAMAAPQHDAPRQLRREVMRTVRAEARPSAPGARSRARSPRRESRWAGAWLTPRPALAAGFAVLVAAVVLGAVLISGGGSSTRVYHAQIGQAEVRITGGHGELVVNHLPAPEPGRIYEVWLKRAGKPPAPTSTLFSVTASGRSDVGLTDNLSGVQEILVTSEPAPSGSKVPTRPPVIVAPLSRSA